MKWTIKLVVEVFPGSSVEREVGSIERTEEVSPATMGLTIGGGQRPERNFEVVVGKALDRDGSLPAETEVSKAGERPLWRVFCCCLW